MTTIFEAIKDSELGYTPTQRTDILSGDYKDIAAATKNLDTCSCRGKCGSHTGPCTMKGSKDVGGSKMCKACDMAMSGKKMQAGGPGSGRHAGMSQTQSKMHDLLVSKRFNHKDNNDGTHTYTRGSAGKDTKYTINHGTLTTVTTKPSGDWNHRGDGMSVNGKGVGALQGRLQSVSNTNAYLRNESRNPFK